MWPFIRVQSVTGLNKERSVTVIKIPAVNHVQRIYRQRQDLFPEYKMDYKRRGTVLIFNQERFFLTLNLRERSGTATDKENLTERCSYKFCEKFIELYVLLADHRDADCFVCVFLSHGEDGHVYAHDDKVDIKEITALFRGEQCKSLVGKPKIFIFQACRGDTTDMSVTGMARVENSSYAEEDAASIYTLPAGADFLMCYCVAEGFVAFRHITLGSFYIQDLCETLQQQSSTLEFTELLTLVNLKVSRRTHGNKKQMPCFTSMLTKKLYFRPKKE
uniref:Caspase-6 n=1 Tax=Pygocentrus nattereri TaxID=42514 RepID=A0A3B4CM63_PYGNA